MPIFRPRTRVEIFREMAARVIARSKLVGLFEDSVILHVIAAASDEDAEQYYQMANLRLLFSIDDATGSDLDDRAAEIVPGTIQRRQATFASSTSYQFTRDTSSGVTNISAGTIVYAEDSEGPIRYRTTSPVAITDGNTTVNAPIVALVAGARGNIAAGNIVKFGSRIPGVIGGINLANLDNAADRESDDSFRARIKLYVQALSRGTPTAIRSFALSIALPDSRRVLFCRVVEPVLPTGVFSVYIDDGAGGCDTYDSSFISADDTLLLSALGGETDVFTTRRPIRDDGTFVVKLNATPLVRGTDYLLNAATGQVELANPLSASDTVTANYRYYNGLVQETQRVLEGDPADPVGHPGVRGGGVLALVRPAVKVPQQIVAVVVVASDFDFDTVRTNVQDAIAFYVNNLEIGEPIIVAKVVELAMEVQGVLNFRITSINLGAAEDQVVNKSQVARITSSNVVIA